MVLGNKKENEEIDLGEIDPNMFDDEEEAPPFDIDEEEEDLSFKREEDEESEENAPLFGSKDDESPPFGKDSQAIPPSIPSSEFDEKIASLEDKVNQMDSTLANVRRLHEELEEKINKVEKSLEEMLSVYELVTNEINPFVQKPEETSPIIEQAKPNAETPKQKIEEFSASSLPMDKVNDILQETKGLYLADIRNDPVSIMILLKWIEFMLKKVGFRGMVDLLIYYENIGWISEKVRNKVLKYAREMRINEKPVARKMGVKEHLISLYFIAKLRGLKVDTNVYSSIAYELERIGILY